MKEDSTENIPKWLSSKDEYFLRNWLVKAIVEGDYSPLPYISRDDHEMYFIDFCDHIIKMYKQEGFLQVEVFKNIIREILQEFRLESYTKLWDSKTKACDLLTSILIICFYLKINKISEYVLFLMETELLKGLKNSHDEDLHSCLYRILISIPVPNEYQAKIKELCIRDLKYPNYSYIAYRCLWQTDIINGVKYIQQLHNSFFMDKNAFDFYEKVATFIEENNIFDQMEILKSKLSKKEIENFIYLLLNENFFNTYFKTDKHIEFLFSNGFIVPDIKFKVGNEGAPELIKMVRAKLMKYQVEPFTLLNIEKKLAKKEMSKSFNFDFNIN